MYEIIYIDVNKDKANEDIIKEVVTKCFEKENLACSKLEVTITITTSEYIRQLNKEYRGIDKETDVLSFPMYEKIELDEKIETKDYLNEDVLGDIVISKEQVEKQASEFGHTFQRELSYMIIHGFYHLMGYDHIDKEDKIIMRQKEKEIVQMIKSIQGYGE